MAKALKEPHALAGKTLTTGSCPECKEAVAIKANKNGIAYFYCAARHVGTGDQCNNHGRFSTRLSSKLCAAYLGATNEKITSNEPANDNRAPHEPIVPDQGRERAERGHSPERGHAPERQPEPTPEPQPEPIRNCFGF